MRVSPDEAKIPELMRGADAMSRSRGRALRWEAIVEWFSIFAMHRALYRALGGRFVGRNILILTTTGRRTGQRRSFAHQQRSKGRPQ